MRRNFGAKAILYPMPVLIIGTYDENGKPNAMNAAWGGISEETQISICVDDGHKTAKNVVKTGVFTVSIADAENVVACDYVGIVSGNKEPDKIEKVGWHATKSAFVDAPLFDELLMALECKLISYDEETCRLVGEIVNVCADERILDENDKILRNILESEDAGSIINVIVMENLKETRKKLRESVRKGLKLPASVNTVADMLVGGVAVVLFNWFEEGRPIPREKLLEEISAIITIGGSSL